MFCTLITLDEFPEFDRRMIEALRQPLEDRVIAIARAKRFGREGKTNSELSPRELEELVPLSIASRATLEKAGTRLNLSPRAFHRVIKVARTIADLDEAEHINESHILEALQYRERKG